MARSAADVFLALYRLDGKDLGLSDVRIHVGSDVLCRTWGARALTIGSDIHFRTGEFAPATPEGFWLLAHEVAHVVQQRRGPVSAIRVSGGFAVGRSDACEEDEADAAADAALVHRQFTFASPETNASAYRGDLAVVQRYMSWEHLILGDAKLAAARETTQEAAWPASRERDGISERLAAHCALLEELGQDPENVDAERLKTLYPGIETLRLPGSGLVITLGELSILPDYMSRPADIESAPSQFILPLVQTIREWNLRELRRISGIQATRPRLRGAMRYPDFGRLAEFYETVAIDKLGRKCGTPAWELYSSVVGRNAAHFAPFSWYRWQSFHLLARELIRQASNAVAGHERETCRARARLYAGYADHFLQDSFAAGHLINKTLVMQWYVEWLANSRLLLVDRKLLATMTFSRQPYLHGPGHYFPVPDKDSGWLLPSRMPSAPAVTDPQTAIEAETLREKIEACGVVGADELEQRAAFTRYLALLGSSVAQLAPGIVHGYFNKKSLMVAASPDGPRYRIWGDRYMFQHPEGSGRAADAAQLSRQAIADLLERGGTDVTVREIFEKFPNRVEQDGALLTLPEWHDTYLRARCFNEFFRLRSTRIMRILLTVASRNLGMPSVHYTSLRAEQRH